jgi:hypothetical protein
LLAAGPIPISGYDINDAVISGHGNWAHSYNGTIAPGVSFTNNSFAGTTATYSGVGSGTLNDGVIGGSISNSQLFVNGIATGTDLNSPDDDLPISPSIVLTLPFAYTVNTIELFGGDIPANAIPGAITGVTVGILDNNFVYHEETFATTAFGLVLNSQGIQVNDRVSLAGSSLEGIPAFAIFLSSFQGEVGQWISLTEITLDGDRYVEPNPIPEPATMSLVGLALAGLLWRRAGKRN